MSKDRSNWHPDFAPSYTPEEMLKMGIFEGKYINGIKGLPSSWYKLPKVLGVDDEPDPTINHYGVKSRQPLSTWKKNGWIMTDKEGWFAWYCKYYLGRRLGKEDDIQVKRWKSFVARHSAQVIKNCTKGDKTCRPKQKQGLLQWAWDAEHEMTEEQLKKNQSKLKVKISNESRSLLPSLMW